MEYQYSSEIDPSAYATQGLCEGVPLRAHHNPQLEEIGTLRAQEDWRKHVANVQNYRGGLGPVYSFMTVAVPECLPNRLEIISYANEFAFLYDDITDRVSQLQGDEENDRMLDAFLEGAQAGSIEAKGSGKRHIQAQMLLEMLAIDRERALTTMKMWAVFVKTASGRQHATHFRSLQEYIPYRIIDVGQMFWFGLMTFGMGLTIPEEEMSICAQLCRPAWITAGLTNDLFSWQKEHDAAVENGQSDVVNAIWVLMGEHSITVDEAKAMCRQMIREAVAEYVQVVKETRIRTDISLDLRIYVEALQYSLSGNVVWSMQCPRYHPKASYNDRQQEWMKNGVPEISKLPSAGVFQSTNAMRDGVKPVAELIKPKVNGHDLPQRKSANGFIAVNGVNGENGVKRTSYGLINGNGFNDLKHTNEIKAVSINASFGCQNLVLEHNLPDLDEEVILAPFKYLDSLPSKGVRNQVIDALNVWCKIPAQTLKIIKRVINILHGLSLMLDDIEDSSPLRRSKPATHTIFGTGQTINSANYHIIQALDEVRKLDSQQCLEIFCEEMRTLFLGQSCDLYWRCNLVCPSIGEYLKMVDSKTGGLFKLLAKLMSVQATTRFEIDTDRLVTLVGRYFQIRDDYQNLASNDYAQQKGFCEDLDEGKYSLPLIHALEAEQNNMLLRNMLTQRRVAGHLTLKHKELVLEQLKYTKSMEYTAEVLKKLCQEIEDEIRGLEEASGVENLLMRVLLNVLRI